MELPLFQVLFPSMKDGKVFLCLGLLVQSKLLGGILPYMRKLA